MRQKPALTALTQPFFGSQLSAVQARLSSQRRFVPAQTPAAQVSPTVQASPSSHGPLRGV